jgi:methyl-accepting chemotaxis protein
LDTSHRASGVASFRGNEYQSENVAAAMEQSATNTNTVSSAAEEMSSTINELPRIV